MQFSPLTFFCLMFSSGLKSKKHALKLHQSIVFIILGHLSAKHFLFWTRLSPSMPNEVKCTFIMPYCAVWGHNTWQYHNIYDWTYIYIYIYYEQTTNLFHVIKQHERGVEHAWRAERDMIGCWHTWKWGGQKACGKANKTWLHLNIFCIICFNCYNNIIERKGLFLWDEFTWS